MLRFGLIFIVCGWSLAATLADERVPGELVVTSHVNIAGDELLASVSDHDLTYAALRKAPSSLGYGSPHDKAPIPDSLGTLVALQSESGGALIDEHHQSYPATRPISPEVTSKPASPQIQYRRVYVGVSCGANGCSPQYRWEATPVSYTTPVESYPQYDSIGGAAPQTYSYGSYGCAGQSSGCSGNSGNSAGCAGAGGGRMLLRPIRLLFGRRR